MVHRGIFLYVALPGLLVYGFSTLLSRMTVDDLLERFRQSAGEELDNDRILLSKVEKP